jgi:hypothetical protein
LAVDVIKESPNQREMIGGGDTEEDGEKMVMVMIEG